MSGSQTAQISKVVLNVSQGEHSPVTQPLSQISPDAAAAPGQEDPAGSASIVKETLQISQLPVAGGLVQPLAATASPRGKPSTEPSSSSISHETQSVTQPVGRITVASAHQQGTAVSDDLPKNGAGGRGVMRQRVAAEITSGATTASKNGDRQARKAAGALTQTRSVVLQPRQRHRPEAASIRGRKLGASSIARPSALQALRDKKQGVAADAGLALQRDEDNVLAMPASRDVRAHSRKPIPPAPMLEDESNAALKGNEGLCISTNRGEAVPVVQSMPQGKVVPGGNYTKGLGGLSNSATKANSKAADRDTPMIERTKKTTGSLKRPAFPSKKLDADNETSIFNLPLTPGPKEKPEVAQKKQSGLARTKKSASTREATLDAVAPRQAQSKRKSVAAQVGSKPERQPVVSSRSQGGTLTRSKVKAKASTRMCVDEEDGPQAPELSVIARTEPQSRLLAHGSDPLCEPLIHESLSQFESQVVDLDGDVLNTEHMSLQRRGERVAKGINAQGSLITDMQNNDSVRKPDNICTGLQERTSPRAVQDAVQNALSRSSPEAQSILNVRSAFGHEATASELHKTLANLPSSPPEREQQMLPFRTVDLIDERSAGKATLISFDRDGPRNQGTLSGKKSKKALGPQQSIQVLPKDPRQVSEHLQSGRAQLSSGKHKAPSVQSATTSIWDHFMAPPSNVANNTSDALAEFRRGTSGAATSHTTISSMQATEQVTHPDDDDAFIFIDDVDTTEAIVPDDHKFTKKVTAQPKRLTLSQMEMPPPGFSSSKISVPSKRSIERAEKHSRKHASPNVPITFSAESKSKRPREVTRQREENIHKRQRMTNDVSLGTIMRIFDKKTSTSSQGRQILENKAVTTAQPLLNNRREARGHNAKRKPSQTVDIQGSPIPAGVELLAADDRTVLEVLSQSRQLALSSEVLHGVTSPNYIAGLGFVQPLSPQGEVLASNMKSVPASSNDESLGMAGTVLGRLNSARIVKPIGHDQDPFNSTYSAHRQEPTEFSKKLLLMTRGLADARPVAAPTAVDADQPLVHPRTENHSLPSSSESDVSSEPHPNALSDIGTWRAALRTDQIDLFDELVSICHKLVRHLVSHETARSDAVTDYQKRGAHIIRAMEATHAAQYTRHVAHLANVRKTVGRRLAACGEKLHSVRASLAELKPQREEQGGRKHDVQGALRQVMATFC